MITLEPADKRLAMHDTDQSLCMKHITGEPMAGYAVVGRARLGKRDVHMDMNANVTQICLIGSSRIIELHA